MLNDIETKADSVATLVKVLFTNHTITGSTFLLLLKQFSSSFIINSVLPS
jgi:hypothetical protein